MAFGISPNLLALSPSDYLSLKEQKRRNLASEQLNRESAFADLVNSRKTIKVGGSTGGKSSALTHESSFLNKRQSEPQESRPKTDYELDRAEKLQESRLKAQEQRETERRKAEIEEAKAQSEHQRKIELEILKANLKGEEPKNMSDYKLQDVINDINSGNLEFKEGDVMSPASDINQARQAVKQRGFAISHPDIQKALEERYAKQPVNNATFTSALAQAKNIQAGTALPSTSQNKGFSEIVVTDRLTGLPYKMNPQTGRWELVK